MSTPSFSIINTDAFSMLYDIPDGSIELIVTDPPYESLEKHRKIGTTTRLKHSKASSNDWFDIFPNSKFEELFAQFYRILTNNSHFYLFCDSETMFVAKPIAERIGFKFWKPIVWDKQKIGMGYHYRARYEFILFFEKGKRKLRDLSIPDILAADRIRGGYPTEKPVEISEILIKQSTMDGGKVLDPFMGSGSTGVAAVKNCRNFIGSDKCLEAFDITRSRLEESGGAEIKFEEMFAGFSKSPVQLNLGVP